MTTRDDLREIVAGVAGLREIGPLEERVASLEVAVAENAVLAEGLEQVVERLERAVAGMVDGDAHDEMGA